MLVGVATRQYARSLELLRWVAPGVFEAVKGFRRVKGYAMEPFSKVPKVLGEGEGA
jgi:hypothetical protein